MPAYIHGSLAVEQRSEPMEKPRQQGNNAAAVPKSLPVSEKLFYLFTVVVCVMVACVVIWRYAQIYELNTRVHMIEQKISQLEAENNSLKLEINKLQSPPRLIDEAEKRGFEPIAERQVSRIVSMGETKPSF